MLRLNIFILLLVMVDLSGEEQQANVKAGNPLAFTYFHKLYGSAWLATPMPGIIAGSLSPYSIEILDIN